MCVYVAAALGKAQHAGWVAAGIGLPTALGAAFVIREVPVTFLAPTMPSPLAYAARPTWVLASAAALFLLVLLPILGAKLPAFNDYANHLARMYVIALHGKDAVLDGFYGVRWRIIPNLGMDIVLPWVVAATNPYLAGKLFVVGYTLLLLAGPHAIHFALYRRWSLGPLVAVLFAYNYIAKLGVLNYQLGVGVALFAIASWIALHRAPPLTRGLVSLLWVVVLFFCHLVTLGIYGLAIGSFELWMLWSRPGTMRGRASDIAALALPFVPAVLMLLPDVLNHAPTVPTSWGGVHARLDGLRFLFQTYRPTLDLLAMAAVVAGFVWAAWRRMLQFHPFGWIFLAAAAMAYAVIPNVSMGSWGAAVRLPIAVLFILNGLIEWRLPSARLRWTFLLIVGALALFRTATVEAGFLDYDHARIDFEASLRFVSPGARLLVAADYSHQSDPLEAIWELPCLAVIERSSLVSLEFSDPMQQVLVVRPAYRASAGGYSDDPVPLPELLKPPPHDMPPYSIAGAPSGRIYWADWVHTYDYVYIFDRPDTSNLAPGRLEPLFTGDHMQLFQVKR